MLSSIDLVNLASLERHGWFGVSKMQRESGLSYNQAARRIDELVDKGHLKRHEFYPYMVKKT